MTAQGLLGIGYSPRDWGFSQIDTVISDQWTILLFESSNSTDNDGREDVFGMGTWGCWACNKKSNNLTFYDKYSISNSFRFGKATAIAWDGWVNSNAETGIGVGRVSAWEGGCYGHQNWASWLQSGPLWLRCQDQMDLLSWSYRSFSYVWTANCYIQNSRRAGLV